MNRNTAIFGGVIGVAVAAVVITLLVTRTPKTNAPVVETPAKTTQVPSGSSSTTTTTQTRQASAPAVTTSATTSPTDTTVILKGSVTPNGAFTNYWYEYGTTGNLGATTSKQSLGGGYTSTSAPGYITNLIKDTTYYYRLVAENQYGRVVGNTYTFVTTHGALPPVGGVPTARTTAATSVNRTDVVLNGEIVPNRSATVYWFEYGTTANLGNTVAFASAGTGSSKVTVKASLADLLPDTTYYYRLDAQNQFGTVQGGILSVKTDGPANITVPNATTGTSSSVRSTTATVRGSVNPNGGATTYWFEYAPDSVVGNVLTSSTTHRSAGNGTRDVSVQADLSGLTSGTKYFYQIVAENNLGIIRGDRMSFTTK